MPPKKTIKTRSKSTHKDKETLSEEETLQTTKISTRATSKPAPLEDKQTDNKLFKTETKSTSPSSSSKETGRETTKSPIENSKTTTKSSSKSRKKIQLKEKSLSPEKMNEEAQIIEKKGEDTKQGEAQVNETKV